MSRKPSIYRLCDRLVRKGCILTEVKESGELKNPEGCLLELDEEEFCPFEYTKENKEKILKWLKEW